jgi:hypothetical protein
MKKIILLLAIVCGSFAAKSQTVLYSVENVYDSPINYSDTWYTWHGSYYGNGFEVHYQFTLSGYFIYDLVLYAGTFTNGNSNEFGITFANETDNTSFQDVVTPTVANANDITLTDSFYVGNSGTKGFLFNIGYISSNGNHADIGVYCDVHW